MKFRLVDIFFIVIGLAVGAILSLQVRSHPVASGSFSLDQLEIKKTLLETFSIEQAELKKKLALVEAKKAESQKIIEGRSSRQTLEILNHLKALTGLNGVQGQGIRITLGDNPAVSRLDFSALNENFVQATDLRDLVNALFAKEAKAIAVNGKRIEPLTPVQSVFDSILIGNLQIAPPFVVDAVGSSSALQEAVHSLRQKKIQISVEVVGNLKIAPIETLRALQYLSLANP